VNSQSLQYFLYSKRDRTTFIYVKFPHFQELGVQVSLKMNSFLLTHFSFLTSVISSFDSSLLATCISVEWTIRLVEDTYLKPYYFNSIGMKKNYGHIPSIQKLFIKAKVYLD
jgi:hypothetical protein